MSQPVTRASALKASEIARRFSYTPGGPNTYLACFLIGALVVGATSTGLIALHNALEEKHGEAVTAYSETRKSYAAARIDAINTAAEYTDVKATAGQYIATTTSAVNGLAGFLAPEALTDSRGSLDVLIAAEAPFPTLAEKFPSIPQLNPEVNTTADYEEAIAATQRETKNARTQANANTRNILGAVTATFELNEDLHVVAGLTVPEAATVTAANTEATETHRAAVTAAANSAVESATGPAPELLTFVETRNALINDNTRAVNERVAREAAAREAAARAAAEQARKAAQQNQGGNTSRKSAGGGGGSTTPKNSGKSRTPAPGPVTPSAPTTRGEAYFRQVLSGLGFSGQLVVTGSPCGGRNAACVWTGSPYRMEVNPSVFGKSNSYLRGLAHHEYAHVVTMVLRPAPHSGTPGWNQFGSWEKMADCMAYARLGYYYGSSYGHRCTGEDVRVASNLWNGNWGV